ncbi:hypothetical protein KFL_000730030 [Klebsormidium nitens]|uniref:Uncharacterized protein n=1 Tax=Klebsormidium nitens TaxID=105231 RepID=A0A1Y1HXC4_KLENI|nr:hypothetical protein KFL_000730030 [Klebsormidium nitens]|eukprot:GAQ81166.1 hypothetical protein KFL_000730030 [Klebsormidium nitens]
MEKIWGAKRPCRLLALAAVFALLTVAASAADNAEPQFHPSGFRYMDSEWGNEDPLFMEENFVQHMRALTSIDDNTDDCNFYGSNFYGHCPSPSPSPSATPAPSSSPQPSGTPEPSASPEPGSPEASASPQPSESPAPLPSPSPSDSAAPTGNPTPTPTSTVPTTPTKTPSPAIDFVAKAMDGYMQNCTVFLDVNDDGIHNAGEPIGVTDQYGVFKAPNVAAPAWLIFVGAGEPGCIDSFTGLPAVSRMEAAPGSTVVNPLTTVVAVLMAAGASQSLAEARLAQSLGLPPGIPLGTFDPISATALGTTGGSQFMSALTQLQTVIAGGIQLLSGASGASQQDCALAMYAAIVGMVNNSTGQAGTTLDLTNPAQLQAVLATSAVALNNVTGGTVTLSTAVLSAAASGMSSVNTLISSAAASGANSTDILVQLARLGLVSQGAMASSLNDLATGRVTPAQFEATNTGSALTDAVAAARAPGETLISDFVQKEITGNAPAPAPATPTPTTAPAPRSESAGVGSAAIIIIVVVCSIVFVSLLGGGFWYMRMRSGAAIQPDGAPLAGGPYNAMSTPVEPIRGGQAGASAWDPATGGQLRQRPGLQ